MVPEDVQLRWRHLRNRFPEHYFRGDEPLFTEIADSNLSFADRYILVQMYRVYHQFKQKQLFDRCLLNKKWERLSHLDERCLLELESLKPKLSSALYDPVFDGP
jgi:hypothetical protein